MVLPTLKKIEQMKCKIIKIRCNYYFKHVSMFQKLQKYDLITHTIFAMVNLCKVQEICQSNAIF
jgi:hypothetical protein